MLKSIYSFSNYYQRLLISILFIVQLIISILEFSTLSLIPVLILYLDNPTRAVEKIDNFQAYLSDNYFNINFDVSLYLIFIFLIVLVIFKNIFQILNTILEGYIIKILNYFNVNKIYSFYLNQSLVKIINNRSSEFIRDITSETGKAIAYLINYLMILKEIILLTFIFISIFINNYLVAIFSFFIFLILMILIYFSLNKKLYDKGKIEWSSKANIIENITNYLGIIKEIKIYKLEKFFSEYFSSNLRKRLKSQMFRYIIQKILRNVFEITLVLLIIIGAIFAKSSTEDYSNLFPLLGLLIVAFLRIIPVLTNINSSIAGLIYSKPSFNNIKKIIENINVKSTDQNIEHKKVVKNFEKLEFNKISFSYGKQKVFNEFSFNLLKNNIIGITGSSGSGKTTLLNIITGLLVINSGEVKINNELISKNYFEISDDNIGYVPQDVFLINGSIKSNITIGNNSIDVNELDLKKAIEISCVKDIFSNNSNINLETEIYDKGQNLSGGQKQRIGIARALYRNPSLLILDEATNQIDNITKIKILKNLKENYKDMTTIIVSHDSNVMKYSDYLIELDKN
jgi:ABC-type multidrug transport system fused ATPase/permease subunit